MKRTRILFYSLALAFAAIATVYRQLTLKPPDEYIAQTLTPKADVRAESEDDKTRRKLLGIWQGEYQGKRTMTLNEDGTGTMLVELNGVQAILFASKLRFDMKWSLNGKKLTKKTVGGEPEDKVNLILNTMGNTADENILELGEDRLLLLDKDGKTKYDWRRVK